MTQPNVELTNILQRDPGIDPQYRHIPKHAAPGDVIAPPGAMLKWYAVYPTDRPVPTELTQLARSYLMKNQLEAKGCGFVILHRCGNDFYFLIVNTWRNNNELWETVFYKNGDAMDDFAPSRARQRTSQPIAFGNLSLCGTKSRRGSDS